MPHRAVRAARKHFEPAILVAPHFDQVDPATQRLPPAQAAAGRVLPDVPEGRVGAACEQLKPAVGIAPGLDDVTRSAGAMQKNGTWMLLGAVFVWMTS